MAQQRGLALEQHAAVVRELDIGFSDSLNPRQSITNKFAPIADVAVARPILSRRATLAAGLFVQGGSGASFKDVATPFGTRDDFSAKFGILKASADGAALDGPAPDYTRASFGPCIGT